MNPVSNAVSGPIIDSRKPALIGYLPIGYPTLAASIDAATAIVEAGVDIIEFGLPYSDPVMDGAVIQAAAETSLREGFRLSHVFEAVSAVATTGAAILVMTYWNPVLRYGVSSFARDLTNAGGAGLVTPDLIPDEADEWLAASNDHDLDRVFLVAPSSTDERLAMTAHDCRGFVYAASTMGVTGVRSAVDGDAQKLVTRARAAGAERVCVGLGVSTAEQAAEIGEYADGVIVGSALVRALGSEPNSADGVKAVGSLAKELALGLESVRVAH